MDKQKNLEQILENLAFDDAPDRGHQDRLEMKLLGHFNAARFRPETKWRTVMNSKLTKLAAAAMILIGVLIGLGIFNGTSSVSWAQVSQQVAAVKAVMYKALVMGTEKGQPFEVEMQAVLADEYGTRMDTYMGNQLLGSSFTLADKKTHIYVMPTQKKYIEVDLTEEIRIENGDPKLIVDSFLNNDYTELGQREIDGVKVQGIQSQNVSLTDGIPGGKGLMDALKGLSASITANLWVDVDTGWPVEITLEVTQRNGGEQMTIVINDFQWDAQIDPTTFSAVIPEGYELMYKINAEHLEKGNQLVEGLAYFAHISDGKYPEKLTVRDVVIEMGEICQAKSGDPSFSFDDAQGCTLKYGAQFFGTLEADGKDPVYYGRTVTAADTDKVLVRWKLDDGKYRVIFGDLRIQDLNPEQMSAREKP